MTSDRCRAGRAAAPGSPPARGPASPGLAGDPVGRGASLPGPPCEEDQERPVPAVRVGHLAGEDGELRAVRARRGPAVRRARARSAADPGAAPRAGAELSSVDDARARHADRAVTGKSVKTGVATPVFTSTFIAMRAESSGVKRVTAGAGGGGPGGRSAVIRRARRRRQRARTPAAARLSAASAAPSARPVTATARGAAQAAPAHYRVATFNVLGWNHTINGARGFAGAMRRMVWTRRLLNRHHIDVAGFQELQVPQVRRMRRAHRAPVGALPGAPAAGRATARTPSAGAGRSSGSWPAPR